MGWILLSSYRPPALHSTPVAPAAPTETLPEVVQQPPPPAPSGLDVGSRFGRALRPLEVRRHPENQARGGTTVPPRPPRFLIVGLERTRRSPVDHAAHVRLVDSHAEGARRYHDRGAAGEEDRPHLPPHRRGDPRMVGRGAHAAQQQRPRHQLGEPPRRCIHDATPLRATDQLVDACEAPAIVAHSLDREDQDGTIERRDDHLRPRQSQHAENLGARGGGGAAGEGEGGGIAEEIPVLAQAAVQPAKLVPPFDDAVRLIYREQRDRRARANQAADQRAQSLGSAIEELQAAREGRLEDGALLVGRKQAVQVSRRDPTPPQRGAPALHQRDEGRDHEREPVRHERGELEAKRLPGAGGEDGENVVPGEERPDDSELVDAQGPVAEVLPQRVPRRVEAAAEPGHCPRKRRFARTRDPNRPERGNSHATGNSAAPAGAMVLGAPKSVAISPRTGTARPWPEWLTTNVKGS